MREKNAIPLIVLAAVVSLVVSCAQTTDAGITGLVKTKLAADGKVSASEINVDTTDGVVTLTGNVDSQEAKDQALKLAKETSGVRDVKDMIAVRTGSQSGEAPNPNLTVGEHIDDAGITMRVKARLLDDPVVKGLKIDVDTRDGVVFLTGSVTSDAERKQAIELARTTEGVKDVQANFQ
jgi:hyperosmotically inducible periplasmic protein